MKKTCVAAAAALSLLGAAPALHAQQIALSTFATGLGGVVHIQHGGDGSGRLYFVQQTGIIRVHDGTAVRPTPFLNIDPIVMGGGEEGLLSVAFHPNYASNGFFYVYYTNNSGNNVVARYQRSATDPFVANPNSGVILLTINHPNFSNHNGGQLQFGPDGYLYIATGDGGGGGDPDENAQNLGSMLGKQMRIDVNSGSPYGIPPTNPFVGTPGARPEIWAYGLRNPFRFTFDRQTGDMFIGDVGQNAWEEVDFQAAGVGGLNYGWDDMEGTHCYEPPSGCLTANRVLPIFEIGHGNGDCAIIGGYRYRGTQVPGLVGRYLHSDNCSGRIRVSTETSPGVWQAETFVLASGHAITTFGEDQNGELYVSATDNSTIYRVVAPPPTAISIADRTVAENAGSASFTVSLSAALNAAVTVQYATAAGTATAGTDYTTVSGTITFPAATTTRTVTVPIVNDALDENDETFTVNLTAPSANASIADGTGQGTITDDDPLPALAVSDCTVVEGDAGSTPCTMNVALTPVSGRAVTFSYFTQSGTAVSGSDFTAASGSFTFAPGATTTSVPVGVLGDTAVETDETFSLALATPGNATLGDAQGDATILDDDATSLSSLELTHGSRTVADLALGTPDFYRVGQAPRASYELVIDEVSGDAVPGLVVDRLAADNATVLQSSAVTGTGSAASLRWMNTVTAPVTTQHLRVASPACGSGCGADDTYRLRLFETTLAASRFNNANGQTSVVVLQNATSQPISGLADFWSQSGVRLHTASFTLAGRASLTITTPGIPALQGQSGSLTILHDGPYGGLAGKAVALEPASGFSFDTPLEPRPH